MLELKQEPLLKRYIEQNTDLRREAKQKGNKIKKQTTKFRNRAVFRK